MQVYKGINYAVNTDLMNVSTISSQEATSIDSKIVEIGGYGLVNIAKDAAADDALFSEFGIYTQVWRVDLGYQVTAGLASQVGNEPGLFPIPVSSVVTSGATASFTTDGVSGVSFTNCTGLYLNNIFTPEFDNYKVIIDVTSNSSGDTFSIRYTTAGVFDSTAVYVRAGYGANSSTPSVFYNNAAAGNFLISDGAARNFTTEVEFMKPAGGYYPMAMSSICSNNGSTLQTTAQHVCQYNSATAPAFDGIYIYSSSTGTSAANGTVRVYGYN